MATEGIPVECEHCGNGFRVKPEAAGRRTQRPVPTMWGEDTGSGASRRTSGSIRADGGVHATTHATDTRAAAILVTVQCSAER